MTLGQLGNLARLLNRKATRAIRALQVLEAVDGDAAGAGCKLEQTALLLRVQAADALPKVLDDLVRLGVASVVRVLLPVLDVNVGDAADEELQLALVKHRNQVRRDQLVEARDEGLELLLDPLLDAPFRDEPASG